MSDFDDGPVMPDGAPPMPPEPEPAGRPVVEAGSILDQIRAEYENVSLEETRVFDVEPSEHFAVRYRYVAPEQFEAAAESLQKIKSLSVRNLYAACDSLRLACDEIVVYAGGVDEDGEPNVASLIDDEEFRFDTHLAEALGWDRGRSKPLTDRQIVLRVFKGNEQALIDHALEVSAWMKTVGSSVRSKTAGE